MGFYVVRFRVTAGGRAADRIGILFPGPDDSGGTTLYDETEALGQGGYAAIIDPADPTQAFRYEAFIGELREAIEWATEVDKDAIFSPLPTPDLTGWQDRWQDGGAMGAKWERERPIVSGEQFAPGYTVEAAAYEQRTREG
jgi:hypothetical protein